MIGHSITMNCSLKDRLLEYDRMVPRYTSYPTAPHFAGGFTHDKYKVWLSGLSDEAKLSLYLHLPFCPKLCWYCGCNTKITQRYSPVEDYAHLLMREIEILADALGGKKTVTNIHFGGGSPGMLRARDFEQVMIKLHDNFAIDKDAHIAIEIDPREITEGRIATYAKYGMNRASIGVQDFNEKVLHAINRPQPFHQSHNAVELLREYGITDINFDLLYGLPHQSVETMIETLEKALMLEPSRIALFGYAHVPWMKKHMRLIDEQALPEKEERYDMFETGKEILEKAGYTQVGIDHFARAGDPLLNAARNGQLHRNFQGYTTDAADALLGIGASSIGKLQDGYVQNAPDMPTYRSYILDGKLPALKSCALTDEDRLRAEIIERLMCLFTVNIPQLCQKYRFDENRFNGEMMDLMHWADQGMIEISADGTITIQPEAHMITRLIAAVFDQYLDQSQSAAPRHARAI